MSVTPFRTDFQSQNSALMAWGLFSIIGVVWWIATGAAVLAIILAQILTRSVLS